jgi:isopentenyl-diphosphate delta-isomerase
MAMKESLLIRIDADDNAVGVIEKMKAHREGILHRAFSVFIFNAKGQWLLQRRTESKYHSGGLWSNACCGHPLNGEETFVAAINRLQFEMGLTCSLVPAFNFTYRAELDHGLVEHEFDHVFIGYTDETPLPNPDEVSEWHYVSSDELFRQIRDESNLFTEWFKMIYQKVEKYSSR